MGRELPVFELGLKGVDMRSNPFFLGSSKFAEARNMIFDEGQGRTRYGINYHSLGLKGLLQASLRVNLSRTISRGVFANDRELLILVVQGKAYYVSVQQWYVCGNTETPMFSEPVQICDLEFPCDKVK